MFSMCSELTPRAPVPDNRIPQLMQPWSELTKTTRTSCSIITHHPLWWALPYLSTQLFSTTSSQSSPSSPFSTKSSSSTSSCTPITPITTNHHHHLQSCKTTRRLIALKFRPKVSPSTILKLLSNVNPPQTNQQALGSEILAKSENGNEIDDVKFRIGEEVKLKVKSGFICSGHFDRQIAAAATFCI